MRMRRRRSCEAAYHGFEAIYAASCFERYHWHGIDGCQALFASYDELEYRRVTGTLVTSRATSVTKLVTLRASGKRGGGTSKLAATHLGLIMYSSMALRVLLVFALAYLWHISHAQRLLNNHRWRRGNKAFLLPADVHNLAISSPFPVTMHKTPQ